MDDDERKTVLRSLREDGDEKATDFSRQRVPMNGLRSELKDCIWEMVLSSVTIEPSSACSILPSICSTFFSTGVGLISFLYAALYHSSGSNSSSSSCAPGKNALSDHP